MKVKARQYTYAVTLKNGAIKTETVTSYEKKGIRAFRLEYPDVKVLDVEIVGRCWKSFEADESSLTPIDDENYENNENEED